jgi:hypothetical protein
MVGDRAGMVKFCAARHRVDEVKPNYQEKKSPRSVTWFASPFCCLMLRDRCATFWEKGKFGWERKRAYCEL